MESAHLQNSGIVFYTCHKTKEAISDRLTLSIASGITLAVAGIFIILAAAQIVPNGVNIISSTGIWGYVSGTLVISSGLTSIVVSLVVHFRRKPQVKLDKAVGEKEFDQFCDYRKSAAISEKEFDQFCAYRKGADKAYAHALGASFFYYNCDEKKDYGWGCAWRCIQICASAANLFPPFQELYDKYHQDAESTSEWAEPGYGKRYFDDAGIPNELILYNKENGTRKTPTEWCKKMKGFPALRDKLVDHFTQYATPVMADDAIYALTIVGIRVTDADETILFIADPHKINRESGLYYVVLDEEGNQIATTGIDNGTNGLSTVKSVHFNKGKGWMLLFPQPVQDDIG